MLTPALLALATVTVSIDSAHPIGPISRYVYGTNETDWTGSGAYLTLGRQGGNRWTAYNWENNASNAGSDWFNQNDDFLGGGNVPGEAVRARVADALPGGRGMVVTVPLAGYAAGDKNGGGDVNQTPNYLATRFRKVEPRKGAAFVYPPSLTDDFVYVDEFVKWLETEFSGRTADQPIFYSLDNEPDLWAFTHSRIHPEKARYDEMAQKTKATARAIKDVAPNASVFGFVSYGYNGYVSLQDAPDAAGRNFIDFYLDSMRAAESEVGRRLLDVLDLHWYPEAQGNGQRITGNDTSAGSVAARVQAPRSLWDPTYTEASWITQWMTNGPIKLIPTLRSQIAAHYPNTKLAFTEYNYGASNHISGAVAQADALGVFGREGVFAACFWPLQGDNRFVHAAFDAFRNYDGRGGRFGDVSLPAVSSDVSTVTAYASRSTSRRSAKYVAILINKATTPTTVTLNLDFKVRGAHVYTLSGSTPAMKGPKKQAFRGQSGTLTLPALSVTTIAVQ